MPTNNLKQRLASRTLLVAPGVFDMVSLRLANTFGFDALYMTGYGTVASHLGLPDAGSRPIPTWSAASGAMAAQADGAADRRRRHRATAACSTCAARCAATRTRAPAAIQLEDQEFPKKCGHTPGRRVIPDRGHGAEDPRGGRVALEPGFPDRRAHRRAHRARLDEALRRAEALRAGRRRRAVRRVAGVDRGDATHRRALRPAAGGQHGREGPHAGAARAELQALGYRIAIFPVTALLAAVQAPWAILRRI